MRLEYMRTGDTVVATHLVRLGRNMYEAVTTNANLTARQTKVQVLDSVLDSSRPADEGVVHVMASLAAWSRALL